MRGALHFIRRPTGWASVDWENSGWGEPAFEIVDLMTHLAYLDMPEARWEALIAQYTRLSVDHHAPEKIATFLPLMLIWWGVTNLFARQRWPSPPIPRSRGLRPQERGNSVNMRLIPPLQCAQRTGAGG
jgi:hypothetical protein